MTGVPATFVAVAPEVFAKSGAPQEFVETMTWFREYGYYNGDDLKESVEIVPDAHTWEQWLRASGWRVTA